MKYHKIRNVPKEICTLEQVVAYNTAFDCLDFYEDLYKAQVVQIHKTDVVFEFVNHCMKNLRSNENVKKRCDLDSVKSCLLAGAEDYLSGSHHILINYKDVGKMFPAYYL